MRFLQIKESCLYSTDLIKTRNFYEKILGLKVISALGNEHVFFKVGTSVLLFFNPTRSKKKISPPGHYATGKQHIAFEIPQSSYASYKKKILEKGITIIDEVSWEDNYKSFYFNDPNGHVLEIVPKGMWD